MKGGYPQKRTSSGLLILAVAVTTLALSNTGEAATYAFTDLNPDSLFPGSQGKGISGGQQVGLGFEIDIGSGHALLWSGTAASAVDLNPVGFTSSYAYSI